MRKRINGKTLDTTTATLIGTAGVDENKDIVEQLFCTKGGAYFFYRVVALPKVGNEIRTSEDIQLVTYDEAKKWAKEKLAGDEYLFAFGFAKKSDNAVINLTVALPKRVHNILKFFKAKAGKSYGETITEAIIDRFGIEFPEDELGFDDDDIR